MKKKSAPKVSANPVVKKQHDSNLVVQSTSKRMSTAMKPTQMKKASKTVPKEQDQQQQQQFLTKQQMEIAYDNVEQMANKKYAQHEKDYTGKISKEKVIEETYLPQKSKKAAAPQLKVQPTKAETVQKIHQNQTKKKSIPVNNPKMMMGNNNTQNTMSNQTTKTFKNPIHNFQQNDQKHFVDNDATQYENLEDLGLTSEYSKDKQLCQNNWKNPQQQGYTQSKEFEELVKKIKQKLIKIIPFEKIINDGQIIGEGGYGSVYAGKWSNTGVAIKEMFMSYSEFNTMDQEMSFMAANRHPKLVNMFGIAITEIRQNKLQCCIVMELMQQDLEQFIFSGQKKDQKTLKNKVKILKDVAEGIDFLHQQDIVHRDIKPKNVLLDNDLQAKITDLGISKVLEDKEKTQSATIAFTARYASKETAVDEITSYTNDIWSLGLVMYEVITEKRCWEELNPTKIILALAKEKSPFQEGWENSVQNKDLVQLIQSCSQYEPEKRPRAAQVQKQLTEILSKL